MIPVWQAIAPTPRRRPDDDRQPGKTTWERENVIQVKVKVNRNQDPELFALLQQAESKSGTARDLMKKALFGKQ